MKDATVDDVLEFLQAIPIPEKVIVSKSAIILPRALLIVVFLVFPAQSCEELFLELSSFKKNKKPSASSFPGQYESGGEAKIFSHFFYWGMLVASGDCRNVHPAGVGGEMADDPDKHLRGARNIPDNAGDDVAGLYDNVEVGAGGVGSDDDDDDLDEMHQMVREMQFLRLEGSHREADLLEKEIKRRRQEQLDRVKLR